MALRIHNFAASLTAIELYAVALAVGISILNTRALPLTVGVIAFFWLVRLITGQIRILRTPVDLSILMLCLMIPVTLLVTAFTEITVAHVLRLLSGIGLFYAIVGAVRQRCSRKPPAALWHGQVDKGNSAHVRLPLLRPPTLEMCVNGLLLAGLLIALSAPISVNWVTTKFPIPSAVYSKFHVLLSDSVHPNVMAGTLALLLPIPLALLLFGGFRRGLQGWAFWLAVASTFAMTAILILTQSRGAWSGLASAIVILCLLRWRWLWFVAALLVLAIVIVIIAQPNLPNAALGVLLNDGVSSTVSGRLEIWSRGIYMVQDFPFTGIGMGLHEKLVQAMYPYFINPEPLVHAHNLFLQVAVDLGIPGLIAWLATGFVVLVALWQVVSRGRSLHDPWQMGLCAGLLSSQAVLLVHGLTDAVTWGGIRTAPLVWAVWGVAMAAWVLLDVNFDRRMAQS